MEHLAQLLHHAMKTALFPFFFYQEVTKILNKDSKQSPIKWPLCMQSQWQLCNLIGYGTQCQLRTVTFHHTMSHNVTHHHSGSELKPSSSWAWHASQNSPRVFAQIYLLMLWVKPQCYLTCRMVSRYRFLWEIQLKNEKWFVGNDSDNWSRVLRMREDGSDSLFIEVREARWCHIWTMHWGT